MSLTNDELNSFHQFALNAIQDQGADATIEQLVVQWRAMKEREEANDAIRESISQFADGMGQPVEEFLDEMKQKYDISSDA